MKSFKQFISELYQEEFGSNFEHNGKKYDLNKLLKLSEHLQTEQISVNKLIWIFKWDNPNDEPKRVKNADLNAPILVTLLKKQLVVLDGLHRLEKAVENNKKTILSIYIKQDILDKCEIKNADK